jgi:hypothetical protein
MIKMVLRALPVLVLAGCPGKQTSSLVVAIITAPAAIAGPAPVSLRVADVERSFTVTEGLGSNAVRLGVYVPASVSGTVPIVARAPATAACPLEDTRTVAIAGPGGTYEVSLALHPGSCGDAAAPSDAAVAPDAGTPDATPPPADGPATDLPPPDAGPPVPPTLSRCTEYRQYTMPACDLTAKQGDWWTRAVAFSPDGKVLAQTAQNGRTKIWNVAGTALTDGGREFMSYTMETVAFSPGGALIAAAGNSGQINAWRLANGIREVTFGGFDMTIHWLSFAGDDDRFVTAAEEGALKVWSVARKTMVAAVPTPGLSEAAASLTPPATGPWWVVVATEASKISFVDLNAATPTPLPAFDGGPGVPTVALSPDARLLALANQAGLYLWDVSDKERPVRLSPALKGPEAGIDYSQIAFSPSGRHLAGGLVGQASEVAIYSVDARKQQAGLSTTYYPHGVAFSPDGAALAFGESACGILLYCRD